MFPAPNQRYESWSMSHAHASLVFPAYRLVRKSCTYYFNLTYQQVNLEWAAMNSLEEEYISDALISITISDSSATTTTTGETAFSVFITVGNAEATLEDRKASTSSQTVKGKTARTRSLKLTLGGGWLSDVDAFLGNSILEKQPKNASAQGEKLFRPDRETKEAKAKYLGNYTHACPLGECSSGECPPRMF